jgi:hypothetical protein
MICPKCGKDMEENKLTPGKIPEWQKTCDICLAREAYNKYAREVLNAKNN